MADIFISYAREDSEHAGRLAKALTEHGWEVFWDHTIPPGKTWREVIGTALDSALCVIVLWSASALESDWVIEEAEVGKQKRNLVPVILEDVSPPLGFRSIQAAKLTGWAGDTSHSEFGKLIAACRQVIGVSELPKNDLPTTEEPPGPESKPSGQSPAVKHPEPQRAEPPPPWVEKQAIGLVKSVSITLALLGITLSLFTLYAGVEHREREDKLRNALRESPHLIPPRDRNRVQRLKTELKELTSLIKIVSAICFALGCFACLIAWRKTSGKTSRIFQALGVLSVGMVAWAFLLGPRINFSEVYLAWIATALIYLVLGIVVLRRIGGLRRAEPEGTLA